MSLGTLDRTPPPFFRQGPSALTRLAFFSALALFLMVADTRWRMVDPLRVALATAMLPLQRALAAPVDAVGHVADHLRSLSAALQAQDQARAALAEQSQRAAQAGQLALENERLRALLELRPALSVRSQAAQVLYEAADPYSRKVIIDLGASRGVQRGSPVVNELGLLGQVTRVYPLSSEVTLLTDRDAAVPVLNVRTQQRSAAFGGVGGGANPVMELRFMAGNADVQPGDLLSTSGIDGLYPPGLEVARVTAVDRKGETGFARVTAMPVAMPDGVRHVLVLEPLNLQLPPRPEAPQTAAQAAPSARRKGLGP